MGCSPLGGGEVHPVDLGQSGSLAKFGMQEASYWGEEGRLSLACRKTEKRQESRKSWYKTGKQEPFAGVSATFVGVRSNGVPHTYCWPTA